MSLTMKLLDEKYGVCRMDSLEKIPERAFKSDLYSITKTIDKFSIVCWQENIPGHIKCEKDWRILKVEGPLDFSLIGILSSISTMLAKQKISIFVISTFDTDYILVKERDLKGSIDSLQAQGHNILK